MCEGGPVLSEVGRGDSEGDSLGLTVDRESEQGEGWGEGSENEEGMVQ